MDAEKELQGEVARHREAELKMQAEVCHFKNEKAHCKHLEDHLKDEQQTTKCLRATLQSGDHHFISPSGANCDLNLEEEK